MAEPKKGIFIINFASAETMADKTGKRA